MGNLQTEHVQKLKQRINQFAVAGIIMLFLSTLPDIYFGIWHSVLMVSLTIIYFLACLYFNKKLKSTIFGTLISVGGNAMVFYACVNFGELSKAYLFYITIFIASFLITNYRNKAEAIFNIAHIILAIFLLVIFDFSSLRDTSINSETIMWFGKFNMVVALLSSIYFLIVFVKEISDNVEKLQIAKALLEGQNEELHKKNEELDRLIYSISHDIKAPLSSIEGLVYVTKLESKQPELNEYFDRMLSSTKRLKGFLENVIDFYKNTKFEIISENIDFEHEINLILQNLKYAPNFSEIDFMIDINQTHKIKLDKLRVQTILVNLLSNAIKYQSDEIDHKKIEIKINVDIDKVKIEVADNGIGIPNDIQDKIFEMFYRGTVKSDGSGLGLYILSETVKKLKGTIKLESVPDVYTKFSIEIPSKA